MQSKPIRFVLCSRFERNKQRRQDLVMKVLSWNVNGLRSFKTTVKETLESLDADVVCFQETKITRSALDENSAVIDGYSSYFSFPRHQSGYSGVATYCKDSCRPFHADDTLAHATDNLACHGDYSEFDKKHLAALDSEGRAVLTLHRVQCKEGIQKVAVVNVYCPRADPEKPERCQFKLDFYKLLELRAKAMLSSGYHVVILGDLNTSHRKIDHCDPSDDEDFEANPGRQWLNGFLSGTGEEEEEDGDKIDSTPSSSGFCDSFRHLHPSKERAFTCWNTRIGARQTNYGTRIDYVLLSRGLVGHLVAADIMPDVQGSDHCPVSATLCCSLVPSEQCPPQATRFWPEFAGRQQRLSVFLAKKDSENNCEGSGPPSPKRHKPLTNGRKRSDEKSSQKSLKDFFVNTQKLGEDKRMVHDDRARNERVEPCDSIRNTEKASLAWRGLLTGPPPPPLCRRHGEPCVARVVKKNGPNRGRTFFACARPEGRANDPEAKCDFFQWASSVKKS